MVSGNRFLFVVLVTILPVLAFSSCASAPPPRKVSVKERIEFDRALGSELAEQMAPQISLKKDQQAQAYLGQVAQRLADKNSELHLPATKVYILKDTDRRFRSYALPGGRVYLSSGMLRTLEFESELAGAISIELGHLLNEHIQNYLRKNPAGLRIHDAAAMPDVLPFKTIETPDDIDFFSPDGMFAFSANDNDEAITSAVSIMYNAGYDPRGIVTLLQRLAEGSAHSPWDEAELERLLKLTRKTIALLTPLRNPTVQTDDFLLIRGKLQKL